MSKNYGLRRFAKIEFLRKVDFGLLLPMVRPFRTYIERKGGGAWSDDPRKFPFDSLASILASPGDDAPVKLFDAFFFVDEMSGEKIFDRLYQDALRAGIDFTGYGDLTPHDLAVLIWLQNPELLQRLHAGLHITKARRFETFFGKGGGIFDDGVEVIAGLENALNDFFRLNRKGTGVRVFIFEKDGEFWIMIRHGQPKKREAAITDDGESTGVLYRPEIYDVLIFSPERGDLQIHTSTVGEKKAYCKLIGTHLLRDATYFAYQRAPKKFTLEPFVRGWRQSLICTDIPGIESVTPIEVHFNVGGSPYHVEIHKAADLFEAFEKEKRQIPGHYIAERLGLRIKFVGSDSPRTVILCLPNIAIFERDSDSTPIFTLLDYRSFSLDQTEKNHVATVQQFKLGAGESRSQSNAAASLAK